MSDLGTKYTETLEIEQRMLSRNLNGKIFSHGCYIQTHNISRRSKFKNSKIKVLKKYRDEKL